MCCTPVVFDNFPFWNTSALWWSRGSTGLGGTGGTEGIEGTGLGGTEGTGGTGLGGHLDHRTRAKTKGGAVAVPRFRRKSLVLPIILFIYLFFIVLIVFFYSILTLVKKSRNNTYTAICASLTTPGGVWAWNCCFPPEKSKEFKTSHRLLTSSTMITGSKSYEWIYDRGHIKKGKTSTINY